MEVKPLINHKVLNNESELVNRLTDIIKSEVQGADDSDISFKLNSIKDDLLGLKNIKLDQYYSGLRVNGAQIIAHLRKQGNSYYVAELSGKVVTQFPDRSASVILSKDEAIHRVELAKIKEGGAFK